MKIVFSVILVLVSVCCIAQAQSAVPPLVIDVQPEERGITDTVAVEERYFDEARVESFKSDPEYRYDQPPTFAESLWDRFLMWLSNLLGSIFNSAVTTDWGRIIMYILGVAVLVVIIMAILKVDAFKVFYHGQGASPIKHAVLDENIHEIDFENEIQRALELKDYRRGIRLLFLYALKTLSDQHLISWEKGKTNHDYVGEVQEENMRAWLRQLSHYFEYAWYGNFVVSKELFDRVNNIFVSRKGGAK